MPRGSLRHGAKEAPEDQVAVGAELANRSARENDPYDFMEVTGGYMEVAGWGPGLPEAEVS